MGIFSKKINKEGAIAGMVIGILLMLFYMTKFKFGWFGMVRKRIGGLEFLPKGLVQLL